MQLNVIVEKAHVQECFMSPLVRLNQYIEVLLRLGFAKMYQPLMMVQQLNFKVINVSYLTPK